MQAGVWHGCTHPLKGRQPIGKFKDRFWCSWLDEIEREQRVQQPVGQPLSWSGSGHLALRPAFDKLMELGCIWSTIAQAAFWQRASSQDILEGRLAEVALQMEGVRLGAAAGDGHADTLHI